VDHGKLLAILRCEFVVSKREKAEYRVYRCYKYHVLRGTLNFFFYKILLPIKKKYHGSCCCASIASFSCVYWMEVDKM
jgi:hypothetical protein